MLDNYLVRRDVAVGQLSAGFGGAFLIYGGLILSVFVLQQQVIKAQSATAPVKISFQMPRPVAPPPAPAISKGAPSVSSQVQPTKAVVPVRPTLAPKDVPKSTPEVTPPSSDTPSNNNLFDDLTNNLPPGDPEGSDGGDLKGKKGGKIGGTGDGEGDGPGDVGGDRPLTEEMVAPKKITERCAPPDYPEQARAANLTGTVRLKITVSTEGAVSKINVVDGPEIFQEPAVNYLSNCHFSPALLNGAPITVTKIEKVTFVLR